MATINNDITTDCNYDAINIVLKEDSEKFILKIDGNIILFHRVCYLIKGGNDKSCVLCLKYDGDIYIYDLSFVRCCQNPLKVLTDLLL